MFSLRRKWNVCLIGWLLMSTLILCLPAFAQSGKGVVSGTVADKSGAVLRGARIELLPSSIAGSANNQGEFELRDIPPGHYTLSATYIGFKPRE